MAVRVNMVRAMLKMADVLVNAALSNVAVDREGRGANNSLFCPIFPFDF